MVKLKPKGNRKNYQLDGPWLFYTEDGKKVAEINYREDQKYGVQKSYKEDKLIREDFYVNNKIEGYSKEYFDSGKLRKEIPYKDGKQTGIGYEYDENSDRIIVLNTYKENVLTKRRQINRIDPQQLKQGMWMSFYPNRQLKVEGPYVNDLKNGYWKYYTNTGNLIKVEKWVMGELQQNAEEVAKVEIRRELNPKTGELAFKGSYRNGKPEGVHRKYGEDGEVTESKIYEAGIVLFEGIVDEMGRKQGPWKEFYRTGELKAEGNYKDNLKVGKWVYYFIDGKVEQTGNYRRGKPEGVWTWYHPNRQVWREEEFVDGLEDGPSVEYNDTGAVITKGNYIEGLKDGEWFFQLNDYKEVGKYFDGLRTGSWTHYYLNDIVRFTGDYENGLETNTHTYYYPNGNVQRRGKYVAGMKEGIWDYYNKNGSKTISIEYAAGKEIKYNGKKISYGRRLDRQLAKEESSQSPVN